MQQRIVDYFENQKESMIKDIASLVAIRSVKGEAEEGKPFGEGPAKAIEQAQKIVDAMGFKTTNFENYVLTVDFNDKPLELGIYCHLDVVHEGTDWDTDPFELVVKDGKIFGRGTSDDKGPAMAALYACKAVKDLGIELKKNVRLVLGADEECGSSDLEYYLKKEAPAPFGISPDSSYPVYNVEKGGLKTSFKANYDVNQPLPRLVSLTGGNTINIVPPTAQAIVEGLGVDEVKSFCKEYTKKTGVEFTCVKDGAQIKITAQGKNAHASTPQKGNNAITALIFMVSHMPLAEGKLNGYVKGINAMLPHGDWIGEAAGIKMEDDIAGNLTCSFDIVRIQDGELEGFLDIRSPICATEENVARVLQKNFAKYNLEITNLTMHEPHHVSKDLPFIKLLLKVYEDYTGKKGECLASGGGTYVHFIENSVAFGPSFPETSTNIHGANEFAVIDELIKSAQIYTQVIIDMCS